MLPEGLSFHDAVITAVAAHGDDIALTVEGVQVARAGVPLPAEPENCDLVSGSVTFRGVRRIVINDTPADTITLDGDDGEILRLDWRDGAVELLVVWARGGGGQANNCFYTIACADLVWAPTGPT